MAMDKRLTPEQVRALAARIAGFDPDALENMFGRALWAGDQSDEFYVGLLHGLAIAARFTELPAFAPFVPVLAGFAADKVLKKEAV